MRPEPCPEPCSTAARLLVVWFQASSLTSMLPYAYYDIDIEPLDVDNRKENRQADRQVYR